MSCTRHVAASCHTCSSSSDHEVPHVLQVPVRSPPTPSWIHDFPVTQNYAVLPETPVVFNLKV